ncbi:MAG: hypothetical protein B7Z26_08790 [Asticcacaulis sp. 32-58-5]|nr:MAG: hypothetical protein B7Z26_08790 [Asticcacaulis sp. 32-58-5]
MACRMRMKPIASVCLIAAWLVLSGFTVQESTGQPLDERKVQDALPQSKDAMWDTLVKCKVHLDQKTHKYSIAYTPEVKAMEGKPVTISGFVMPLESTEKFKHFLLSKRTPTCFFCPPGEPNEIVEVFTKKTIKWSDGIVTVTGTFTFTSNPDLGLFFQVKDADSAAGK